MKILKTDNSPTLSRAQRKTNKKALKMRKKKEKLAKRDARILKIGKFFNLKFLRTKKYLAIKRNRATVRAIIAAIIWAIPIAIVALALSPVLVIQWAAVSLLIITIYLMAPNMVKPLVARYKERYKYVVERATANAVFINKKQEKNTIKMAKKHSKWSKKGNKGQAKINKLEAKQRAKEVKSLEKDRLVKEAFKAQSEFVGQIKLNQPTNTSATIKK